MIGVIGGTSFFQSSALREGRVERRVTPYGSVEVVRDEVALRVARHGREGAIPPHAVNHHAHIWLMRNADIRGIVCFGSVGGLAEDVPPGTLVLVDDIYTPHRVASFHRNTMKITVPELRTAWRDRIASLLRNAGHDFRDGGVYAETLGPRFETRAEIRALARVADVVGMTCASEATLAMEVGLPVAVLAMVDNYAHGIGPDPLEGDAFHDLVRANTDRVLAVLNTILDGFRES